MLGVLKTLYNNFHHKIAWVLVVELKSLSADINELTFSPRPWVLGHCSYSFVTATSTNAEHSSLVRHLWDFRPNKLYFCYNGIAKLINVTKFTGNTGVLNSLEKSKSWLLADNSNFIRAYSYTNFWFWIKNFLFCWVLIIK